MTKKDIIEKLQDYPDDTTVYFGLIEPKNSWYLKFIHTESLPIEKGRSKISFILHKMEHESFVKHLIEQRLQCQD